MESDVKSTGMLMASCGVPADFPCGPWLVDPSKEPCHIEGFDAVEKRMVNDLKRYCANRKTPANPADRSKWTMGNFVLAVLSRSTVNAFGKTTCGKRSSDALVGELFTRRASMVQGQQPKQTSRMKCHTRVQTTDASANLLQNM